MPLARPPEKAASVDKTRGGPNFYPAELPEIVTKFPLFCEHFLYVKNPETGELVPFRLNTIQRRIDKTVNEALARGRPALVQVLKARRLGVSTWTAGRFSHRIDTRTGQRGMVIAHRGDDAKTIFSIYERMYNNLPPFLKPKRQGGTGKMISFPKLDSSLEVSSAQAIDVGRGGDVQIAHLSEVAFFPDPEAFLGAFLHQFPVKGDGILVFESTADGPETWWSDLWRKSMDGTSGFIPLFFSCMDEPNNRLTPALAFDELTDEEKELKKQYNLDGQQLAWLRYELETRCFGNVKLRRRELPLCLIANTRISTDKGILHIAEASQATKTESGRIARWGIQPVGETVQLKTRDGRILVGTPNHPVKLLSGEWRHLGNLAPGDKVKLLPPRFANDFYTVSWLISPSVVASFTVKEDWARWLGYYMSDGCCYKGSIGIAVDCKDDDVLHDVVSLDEKLWGSRPQIKHQRSKQGLKGCWHVMVRHPRSWEILESVNAITPSLQNNGWKSGYYKRTTCVPDAIWRSPKLIIREFLRSLFEGDGCGQRTKVMYYNKTEAFVQDIQLLLLGFGIPSRICKRTKPNSRRGWYLGYELTIVGEAAYKFYSDIGFVGSRKQSRRGLMSIEDRKQKGHMLKPIKFEDEVFSIQSAGHEVTYDLTVDGTHSFSANGIETHNSPEEAFTAVGKTAWEPATVMKCYERKHPLWLGTISRKGIVKDPTGELIVWEEPQDRAEYVIGVDVASGLDTGDLSVAEVLRVGRKPGQWPIQVAEWAGRQECVPFAETLSFLGHYYKKAILAVEVTGIGRPVQNALQRTYFYPRLHRWVPWDRYVKHSNTLGWETSWKSKEVMLGLGDWVLRCVKCTLRSPYLVDELMNYQQVGPGEYEGLRGDDRIMAFLISICSWFQNQFPGVPLKDIRPTLAQLYGGTNPTEGKTIQPPQWDPYAEGQDGEESILEKKSSDGWVPHGRRYRGEQEGGGEW